MYKYILGHYTGNDRASITLNVYCYIANYYKCYCCCYGSQLQSFLIDSHDLFKPVVYFEQQLTFNIKL